MKHEDYLCSRIFFILQNLIYAIFYLNSMYSIHLQRRVSLKKLAFWNHLSYSIGPRSFRQPPTGNVCLRFYAIIHSRFKYTHFFYNVHTINIMFLLLSNVIYTSDTTLTIYYILID